MIRRGGELRFFEHVRDERALLRARQSAADPIWSRIGGGCHLTRETQDAITAAGFQIERSERRRFRMGVVESIAETHILGSARRPAGAA